MKGTEGIIEKILIDANEKAKEILDTAEQKKANQEKAIDEWTSDYLAVQRKALKKECEEVIDRKITLSKLDARKILLSAKQEIISEVLDKVIEKLFGLKKAEYLNFVIKLLNANAEEGDEIVLSRDKVLCKKDFDGVNVVKDKNLTFSKEFGDFVGGIILQGKTCDKDLTFKAILEEYKEIYVEKITAELFS